MDASMLGPVIATTVKSMVNKIPNGSRASGDEMEALLGLCMLGVARGGTEDPKALVRRLSDTLLEHAVRHVGQHRGDRVFAPVGQILLVEWCWRNDYLNSDWLWEWEDQGGGRIKFDPRIPLNMVPVPT